MADAKDQRENAADLVRVELAQHPQAAGQARRAARDALLRWRLPHLVDAVVLAASELVTNAFRYGRPPVWIELQRRAQQVQLDIHDGSPTEPALVAEADTDAESGRGLSIVQATADEVVVEQVTDDGKIIHLTFATQPHNNDVT